MEQLTEARTALASKETKYLIDSIKKNYAKAMIEVEFLDDALEEAFNKNKIAIKNDIDLNKLVKKIDKVFTELRAFQKIVNALQLPVKGD